MHKRKPLEEDIYEQVYYETVYVKCLNRVSRNMISELNMGEISWIHQISWIDQERLHDEIGMWAILKEGMEK